MIALALGISVYGCGDDDGDTDAGVDAGGDVGMSDSGDEDTGIEDAGPGDAAPDTFDAGPPVVDWECLEGVTAETPSGDSVSVTLAVVELTGDPVPDANVRACGRMDDDCTTPLGTATTDMNGLATIADLPTGAFGFDGYFELTADGFQDGISVANPPITESNDASAPRITTFLSSGDFGLFAAALGTTANAERGHLAIAARDCGGDATPDDGAVFLTNGRDDNTIGFYLIDGTPDAAAEETDASGQGGFLNVVPGRRGVRVNQSISYVGGLDDVLVRAGWLTTLAVPPSPSEGNWSCLGSVTRGTPSSATAQFFGRVIDGLTQEPVPNVAYRLCNATDTGCATPIATGTTDATGLGTATVPLGATGFTGFVELTVEGYPDTIAFFNPPVIGDFTAETAAVLPIFSDTAITTIETLSGVDIDDTRGQLFAIVEDCGGLNSTDSGASLAVDTADAMSQVFYIRDRAVPDTDATATFVGGFAGYFNLPSGDTGSETATNVSANFMGTAIDGVDLFIRTGWMHEVVLPPAPEP